MKDGKILFSPITLFNESRSTPLPYPPFSQVLLTDVCQVAMKHFNGPDLTLKNSVTTLHCVLLFHGYRLTVFSLFSIST
jgi:hypothetical protein